MDKPVALQDDALVDEKGSDRQISDVSRIGYAQSLAAPDPEALKRGTLKMDFICARDAHVLGRAA
jgi:hypothetical protein